MTKQATAGMTGRHDIKKGDPGMRSGVTSARDVHQLLLAGEFVLEFLVAAVLHFADVLEVVDFCVLLGHLILEIFALGRKSLLRFDSSVQFLAEAVHRIAKPFDGIVGILDNRVIRNIALITTRTATQQFLLNSDCGDSTKYCTYKKSM